MDKHWTFPWEKAASRGEPMPGGLSLADQMAYISLRGIYDGFREKRTTREQAAREKRLLRREWERAKDAEAFGRKLSNYHVRLIKAVERAVCACRKEPTQENALRLCDAVSGIGGGLWEED